MSLTSYRAAPPRVTNVAGPSFYHRRYDRIRLYDGRPSRGCRDAKKQRAADAARRSGDSNGKTAPTSFNRGAGGFDDLYITRKAPVGTPLGSGMHNFFDAARTWRRSPRRSSRVIPPARIACCVASRAVLLRHDQDRFKIAPHRHNPSQVSRTHDHRTRPSLPAIGRMFTRPCLRAPSRAARRRAGPSAGNRCCERTPARRTAPG